MVIHPIQLLSIHIKLILTVWLEAHLITWTNTLLYKVLVRIHHLPHERFVSEWLLNIRINYWNRFNKAVAVICVPPIATAIEVELIRLNKELIVSKK
jgi:hypothetical protein